MPGMPGKGTNSNDGWIRHLLALGITVLSIVGVILLASVMIWKQPQQAQTVLTAVLPLIGTWVGTVLAYYFSKENLESATRSVVTLSQQLTPQEKLKSKPVKEAMIARAQMHVEGPGFNLVHALTWLEAEHRNRIPVLDANDRPLHVVHRSAVDQFIARNARQVPPAPLDTLTLDTLLQDQELGPRLRDSFGLVGENATLAEAKTSMDASPDRQDVFVTKTGTRTEAVLGWITNITVEENSRV